MKTFLIIVLVCSVLATIKRYFEFRTFAKAKDRLISILNKLNESISNSSISDKTKNIIWYSMLGISFTFKMIIYILLFVAIA